MRQFETLLAHSAVSQTDLANKNAILDRFEPLCVRAIYPWEFLGRPRCICNRNLESDPRTWRNVRSEASLAHRRYIPQRQFESQFLL